MARRGNTISDDRPGRDPDDDAPRWRELDEEPGTGASGGDPGPLGGQPLPQDLPDIPGVRLTRWNPYGKIGPEGRRFVQNLARFPNVTAGIIGLLVVIYGAMVLSGWELTLLLPPMWGYPVGIAFGALDADLVREGQWWRLFTAALLHGSLLHLGFNSFMLYQLGRLAENIYGRAGLVILFVGSAIGGGVFSALIGGSMSVGASGAVMGLVGANIVFGLRHKAHIPEFLHGLFGGTLYFYLVLMLLIGLVPGVDGWGHAGGALAGALLGAVLPATILRPEGAPPVRLVFVPAALAGITAVTCVGLVLPGVIGLSGGFSAELRDEFERALDNGRLDQATVLLDEMEAEQPDDPMIEMARMQLAEVAMVEQDWPAAVAQLEHIDASDPDLIASQHTFQNNYAWALFMGHPTDSDRIARGVALARASLEESQDNPTYLNTLAWGLYLQGDDDAALVAIERAIQRNKGRDLEADIYIDIAALYASGERQEAITIYRRAVIDHPRGVLHDEVSAVITAAEQAGEGQEFPRLAWIERSGVAQPDGATPERVTDPSSESAIQPATGIWDDAADQFTGTETEQQDRTSESDGGDPPGRILETEGNPPETPAETWSGREAIWD